MTLMTPIIVKRLYGMMHKSTWTALMKNAPISLEQTEPSKILRIFSRSMNKSNRLKHEEKRIVNLHWWDCSFFAVTVISGVRSVSSSGRNILRGVDMDNPLDGGNIGQEQIT
jgi:hypothetical protein